MSHLDVLELRLSHERCRLAGSKTTAEQSLRKAWITQIEREIAAEYHFLGMSQAELVLADEELLAALQS